MKNSSIKNKIKGILKRFMFAMSSTLGMLAGSKQRENNTIDMNKAIDIVSQMALTGNYTDKCLEKGFLPVRVHYYQPIPDIKDLERRKIWDKVSKLDGIKFESEKYLKFIQFLGEKYGKECDWPNDPTSNPSDFYLDNMCFSYGCASALHCIIREFKPKKIIEVGSGNSSKIIRDATDTNEKESNITAEHTIIDPYSDLDELNFSKHTKIVRKRVEEMEPNFFERLEENDILFIDSSHVSKIGSDVNFEILEVLPVLKKGVIIHFHDIDLPFEYSKIYATNPQFRMFWTEAYLLQSFLMFNNNFEIILPMRYIQTEFGKGFRKSFPNNNKVRNFSSGSFWIRKIK